jgi:hypothetical protein
VPGDDRLSDAIGSTIASVFPEAWGWRPLRFNEIVLALDRPIGGAEIRRRVGRVDAELAPLIPLFRNRLEPIGRTRRPLTDDLAPVEWLTDQMITSYVAEGGTLERDRLPTAP